MRVGIVGHRLLPPGGAAFVERSCADLLENLVRANREVVAISALAEGADMIFGGVAVAFELPLIAVRPHPEHVCDLSTSAAQREYDSLWAMATSRSVMPDARVTPAAYATAMRYVVDQCDLLVAVWDGQPSTTAGGTTATVLYARRLKRHMVRLDPVAQAVSLV